MGRSFLITDDNGIARIFFFFIIILIGFCALIILSDAKSFEVFISIVLLFILLLYLFMRNLFCSRKMILNYENKEIMIRCFARKKLDRNISFGIIKSVVFFEKKEDVADYGEHWQKFVKIVGIQNEILYETKISRIKNYSIIEKLCSKYFFIDYITENEGE